MTENQEKIAQLCTAAIAKGGFPQLKRYDKKSIALCFLPEAKLPSFSLSSDLKDAEIIRIQESLSQSGAVKSYCFAAVYGADHLKKITGFVEDDKLRVILKKSYEMLEELVVSRKPSERV